MQYMTTSPTMAVPAMTQRKAGSVKAGDDTGADAEGGAVRPKGMLSIRKGPRMQEGTQEGVCGEGTTLKSSCGG